MDLFDYHRAYRIGYYNEGLLTEVSGPFFVLGEGINGAKSVFQWPQTKIFENFLCRME